jgi:glycosyltransferase involved in cell wall biosynthesis
MSKLKVLFHTTDEAGVKYFRILTPALQLQNDYSDDFDVELNHTPELSDFEYLKQFNVLHFHRQLLNDIVKQRELFDKLRKAGVKIIADIDDYWELDKTHPYYAISLQERMPQRVIESLKMVDYVTTTTELFAEQIRKHNKNVIVLHNSVNPDIMPQFKDNRNKESDKLRLIYSAGSSHLNDVHQLDGMANIINADNQIKDKIRYMLAGWDIRGNTTTYNIHPQLPEVLQKAGLWTQSFINNFNKVGGNLDLIPEVPQQIKDAFRNQSITQETRPIKPEESVYLNYEKIMTDDHKIITDKAYMQFLMKFGQENYHSDSSQSYVRRWTRPANIYANVLNEADVSLAPLADNMFNRMKSSLKQIEVWTRKMPIICSDIPPYNVDGKNMKNCLLIPVSKNSGKEWAKAVKKLIMNPSLGEDLGNQLHEDFKEKYNLINVTKIRSEFYKSLFN